MKIRKIWIAAAVFAVDRVSKMWVMARKPAGQVLIPGVLGLRYTENRGIAFSLLSGSPVLPALLSLAVLLGAWLLLRNREIGTLPQVGIWMMAGGAAGNLLDRLLLGYVPDFLEVLFVRFAVFNLADACLTVGCGLVIWSLLFRPGDFEKPGKEAAPTGTRETESSTQAKETEKP